jgi:HAD superfamily 5'-nucleotidase-like hydrolase
MNDALDPDDWSAPPPRARGIYCNRTLNLRGIRAIGYDMDYTLIHYRTDEWERRAYEHLQRRLAARGFPVADLAFDPAFVIRGLVIDRELGNVVKANRFGYVKRAFHGTRPLDYDEQRRVYSRTIVDLSERRWVFLNTLFSLSEACMYARLVDLLDARQLPEVLGYDSLYERVRGALDAAHMEGSLKAEIVADPDRFVELDPETPLALLDQRHAGKKLLLITNSEWEYTVAMMGYAFDRFLPSGKAWRDLFDLVIVGARKPEFFSVKSPIFEVTSDDGLLRPLVGALRDGGAYLGGHAGLVERHLGASGDEILYVGDHIYGDVRMSKSVLRWRTALILRELEDEIVALDARRVEQSKLAALMVEKERLELQHWRARLAVVRARDGYGPAPRAPEASLVEHMAELRTRLAALDAEIAPLAKAASEVVSPLWGPLLRAGNDKSHLARQIERSADVYTSRVSNFLLHTPFVYLRSPRGSLPHDPEALPPGGEVPPGAPLDP